jgi:hypothetical protein
MTVAGAALLQFVVDETFEPYVRDLATPAQIGWLETLG